MSFQREVLSPYSYVPNAFPTMASNRAINSTLSPPPLRQSYITPQVRTITTPVVTNVVTTPVANQVTNTVRELVELTKSNNDANFYADRMIYHIHEYGDSNMLLPMIADLTFDMKDLVLMKVSLHFAIRGDILKSLVPLMLYNTLGDVGIERRNKHLKQLAHILKYMERSDMIEHIRERFEGFVFDL